jgi:Fe-S-cluster containining protein
MQFDRTDAQLVQIADAAVAEASARAGTHIACHRGCSICCFGPFPITVRDAARLRRGLAEAPAEIAADVRSRAAEAVARLREDFPGDSSAGTLSLRSEDELAFAERFGDLACPALDLKSGECRLYEHRPIACRLYGPPMRVEGELQQHCPMCFRYAEEREIEACRVSVEFGKIADAGAGGADEQRTLVAFALYD